MRANKQKRQDKTTKKKKKCCMNKETQQEHPELAKLRSQMEATFRNPKAVVSYP